MFEPTRGGTRGGQAEFKWSDVSADKDREHYLGHSINAPTGRWQKNKDVHWYNRDLDQSEAERLEEIRKVKELEAQALGAVLGYEPTTGGVSGGPTSSSNSIPLPVDPEKLAAQKAEKEERKRLKAERKEEKRRKKEEKKARRKDLTKKVTNMNDADTGTAAGRVHLDGLTLLNGLGLLFVGMYLLLVAGATGTNTPLIGTEDPMLKGSIDIHGSILPRRDSPHRCYPIL
ncbi:hypothetical protein D9611_001687 [Ephemerocybe angulata]|uniref:Multiple myeloma tumor-associated protein 2-like N-terminal domain-containing protein n=1 Tax=Ephemerocybe angulata TaxID=980116 RepID=A0A8H5CHT6_9AGAR|nr:hypothetical protein D9611_001687 [Tulosesus angulatus]